MSALDRLRARLAGGFVSFGSARSQVPQESEPRGGSVSAARVGPSERFDRLNLSSWTVPLASLGFCQHLADGTDKTDKTPLQGVARCHRCGEARAAGEIGGFDLNGWICNACLDKAGLLELVPLEPAVERLIMAAERVVAAPDALADRAELMLRGALP